ILAEPRVFVGRWKGDGVQAVDGVAVGDSLVAVEIGPIAAHALARVAGLAVAAVPQHGVLRFTRLIDRHKRCGSGRVPKETADAPDPRFTSADCRHRRLRGMGAVWAA